MANELANFAEPPLLVGRERLIDVLVVFDGIFELLADIALEGLDAAALNDIPSVKALEG